MAASRITLDGAGLVRARRIEAAVSAAGLAGLLATAILAVLIAIPGV